ncbi:hypothetical protein ABIE45_000979 [Methylobacterium sp. OAE515]|uniref:hypothetical protein n=1 Tax=Methylobacterium sp. OAE515 TaxID=2817895 RepID=UPI00178A55AE
MSNWAQVLTEALQAGEQAYRAAWERQGRKDVGTCGSAFVDVPKSHPLAKHAYEAARSFVDGFEPGFATLMHSDPRGVPGVQSINVHRARAEAILACLKDAGIKRARMHAFVD